jgi:hypothetical protein
MTNSSPSDLKRSISDDIKEIDLVLSALNCLRDTNLARLALIYETEERSCE